MKKVYIVKNSYNKNILPIINGEYVCFRSKKDCQAYIDYICNSDCFPYQLHVHPRNNYGESCMYIDMINEGFDYDNGQIFSRIQWSDIVYPTIEILKKASGLYDDMIKLITNNDDEWVIDDDRIYNKNGGFSDVMENKPEYHIYKLKIV